MIYGNKMYMRNNSVSETVEYNDFTEMIYSESFEIESLASSVMEVAILNEGAKEFFAEIFKKIKEFLKKMRDFIRKILSKLDGLINRVMSKIYPDLKWYNGKVFNIKDTMSLVNSIVLDPSFDDGFGEYAQKVDAKINQLGSSRNITKDTIDDIRELSLTAGEKLLENIKKFVTTKDKKAQSELSNAKSFPDFLRVFVDYCKNPKEIQFDHSTVNGLADSIKQHNSNKATIPLIGKKIQRLIDDAEKYCAAIEIRCNICLRSDNVEAVSSAQKLVRGFSFILTNTGKIYESIFGAYVRLIDENDRTINLIWNTAFYKTREEKERSQAQANPA